MEKAAAGVNKVAARVKTTSYHLPVPENSVCIRAEVAQSFTFLIYIILIHLLETLREVALEIWICLIRGLTFTNARVVLSPMVSTCVTRTTLPHTLNLTHLGSFAERQIIRAG